MLLRLPEGLEKKQEQKTLSANAKKKQDKIALILIQLGVLN